MISKGQDPLMRLLGTMRAMVFAKEGAVPVEEGVKVKVKVKDSTAFGNTYEEGNGIFGHRHMPRGIQQWQQSTARREEMLGLQRVTVCMVASAHNRPLYLVDTAHRPSKAFSPAGLAVSPRDDPQRHWAAQPA